MHVSARTNTYEPAAAELARSRMRVHRMMGADQAGKFVGGSRGTVATGSRQTVNEAAADPVLERQNFSVGSVSSALAVLDITALLEAGTARVVSTAANSAAGGVDTTSEAPSAIDLLLTRMLAGH